MSIRFPCFVAGLGVGVAAGLLFAPRRGAATREALRDTAGTVGGKGRELAESQRGNIQAAIAAGVSAYRRAAGVPR
ncbi:MAG: YtxH domain-containing protein [Bryobacterales bacterium]|nr:YtxH domain-containing protein [Bryobacterales bacterium]